MAGDGVQESAVLGARRSHKSGPSYSAFPRSPATPDFPLYALQRTVTPRSETFDMSSSTSPSFRGTHFPNGVIKSWPPATPEDEIHALPYPQSGPISESSSPPQSTIPNRSSIRQNPTSPNSKRASVRRRPSTTSSNFSETSHYPPPAKPLPPLPTGPRNVKRTSTGRSYDEKSFNDVARYSQSSGSARLSLSDVASDSSLSVRRAAATTSSYEPSPTGQHFSESFNIRDSIADRMSIPNNVQLTLQTLLTPDAHKKKSNTVYYLDLSSNASTLASKHGNNLIKIWSIQNGTLQATIKITSYTDAQSRSRDYLIRSHTILSEGSSLVAISVKFGLTIEIWNWTAKKCLQSIENADRWAAGRFEFAEHNWSQIAVYHNAGETMDLYSAARGKKPFAKSRTIELRAAKLPFVPQYPEMAISPTSPILVIAAGPRPPRMGSPPPDKETLLAVWKIDEDDEIRSDAASTSTIVSSEPWRVIRPCEYQELETAVPSDLVTYGSTVASIWIPATFRAVPKATGDGFNLSSVPVTHKVILTWDLSTNATRTFRIPNTIACVSPDCRYVAYCEVGHVSARGTIAIVDIASESVVWSWPNSEAGGVGSRPEDACIQLENLSRITELSFSVDSKYLVIGDVEGRSGTYEVGEEDPNYLVTRMQAHAI